MKVNGLPVLFRKWIGAPKTVIAIFPTVPGTNDPYTCEMYEHVGQHGSGDPRGVIQRTVKATPAEYADLLKELRSIGYRNLVVYDRYQSSFQDAVQMELTRMDEAQAGDRDAKRTTYIYVKRKPAKRKKSTPSGFGGLR